jgi:uncharacterized protein YbjT (DUF2867 family)
MVRPSPPTELPDGLHVAFAGASGAVGRHLTGLLCASPAVAGVYAWQRRPEPAPCNKWHVLPFADDALQSPVQGFACALGTTLKVAGSRSAFRAVDVDAVVARARDARQAGARVAVVVSAVGASPRAAAFYSRCKGEMEDALGDLGFDSLHLLRPSLLLADRGQSRPAEALGQRMAPWLAPLLSGPLSRYRPVTAAAVAAQMLECMLHHTPGTLVHHFDGSTWTSTPR